MRLFYELIYILETYDFSIELIDRCKNVFQLGGWTDEKFERFSKLFIRKLKTSSIQLSDEQVIQILKLIYDRGCLFLIDILFIDGAAFSVKNEFNSYSGELDYKYNRIDFINGSTDYKSMDFLDTTFFFSDVNPRLQHLDRSILPKLRDEINDIFVNYFHNEYFPEVLGDYKAKGSYYAIKYNEEELYNGLNNKVPFSFSIICRIEDESTIKKLDIICDLSADRFLTVTTVDDSYTKLSDIIARSNLVIKEEKTNTNIHRETAAENLGFQKKLVPNQK